MCDLSALLRLPFGWFDPRVRGFSVILLVHGLIGCGGAVAPTLPEHAVTVDEDRDGLDDDWERAFGIDPTVANADDDPDEDGLSHLEEQAAGTDPTVPSLLVELDAMAGRALEDSMLEAARAAFADAGLDLAFFRDEEALPAFDLDGSFEQRHLLLREHGASGPFGPALGDRMVHVMVAARRLDLGARGGELVADVGGDPEKSGVILYRDALEDLHPACGRSEEAPAILVEEALAGTLIHELGHALQLGHDTATGGGINHYNIMSVPSDCAQAQMRFHGIDNDDARLGATEQVSAARFSSDAIEHLDLKARVSVDTSVLLTEGGYEM